jgi:hypothetical protein
MKLLTQFIDFLFNVWLLLIVGIFLDDNTCFIEVWWSCSLVAEFNLRAVVAANSQRITDMTTSSSIFESLKRFGHFLIIYNSWWRWRCEDKWLRLLLGGGSSRGFLFTRQKFERHGLCWFRRKDYVSFEVIFYDSEISIGCWWRKILCQTLGLELQILFSF